MFDLAVLRATKAASTFRLNSFKNKDSAQAHSKRYADRDIISLETNSREKDTLHLARHDFNLSQKINKPLGRVKPLEILCKSLLFSEQPPVSSTNLRYVFIHKSVPMMSYEPQVI